MTITTFFINTYILFLIHTPRVNRVIMASHSSIVEVCAPLSLSTNLFPSLFLYLCLTSLIYTINNINKTFKFIFFWFFFFILIGLNVVFVFIKKMTPSLPKGLSTNTITHAQRTINSNKILLWAILRSRTQESCSHIQLTISCFPIIVPI